MFRRRCRTPELPPPEAAHSVVLPPKEKVRARIEELISDEDVRNMVLDLLDAVYRLKPDSEFLTLVKRWALAYRIADKEDKMIDYMAAITLAFIDYCTKQVYGGDAKGIAFGTVEEKLEEPVEPECRVIAASFEEIKARYTGASIPTRRLIFMSYKWKRETSKLVKLMKNIDKNWCRWTN